MVGDEFARSSGASNGARMISMSIKALPCNESIITQAVIVYIRATH